MGVTDGESSWGDARSSSGFSLETGPGTRASISGNCSAFGRFDLGHLPDLDQKIKSFVNLVNNIPKIDRASCDPNLKKRPHRWGLWEWTKEKPQS